MADIRTGSKSVFVNGCFGEKSGYSALNPSGVIGITGVGSDQIDQSQTYRKVGTESHGSSLPPRSPPNDATEDPKTAGLPNGSDPSPHC